MKKALIAIDIQKGFQAPFWGPRNQPQAEQKMEELLHFWRKLGWPVIHVQHLSRSPVSPLRPGQPGVEFMEFATPLEGEPVFSKSVNSAFIGTALEKYLRDHDLQQLVIMGIATDHCVSTTTRMAANLGFQVTLSADAVFTFDRVDHLGRSVTAHEIHRAALASMHQEFAEVLTQEQLLNGLERI